MKTERMVLLVTPEEKARIAAGASQLGVSASEYVRRAIETFDAEDVIAMEEWATLLPELETMALRIEQRQARWAEQHAEQERQWAYVRSEDYREQVRQELLKDESINWDAVNELFGFDRNQERAA